MADISINKAGYYEYFHPALSEGDGGDNLYWILPGVESNNSMSGHLPVTATVDPIVPCS